MHKKPVNKHDTVTLKGLAFRKEEGIKGVAGRTWRAGQSMVESCIVVAILCLILMGLFQLSRIITAQEILEYAAARGARARTVGFNDFMVFKVVRVGTILTAGRMETPDVDGGPSAQRGIERARIPLYLGSEHAGELSPILDYEDWHTVTFAAPSLDDLIRCQVSQNFPLRSAMHSAFYADDDLALDAVAFQANHYSLYMEEE